MRTRDERLQAGQRRPNAASGLTLVVLNRPFCRLVCSSDLAKASLTCSRGCHIPGTRFDTGAGLWLFFIRFSSLVKITVCRAAGTVVRKPVAPRIAQGMLSSVRSRYRWQSCCPSASLGGTCRRPAVRPDMSHVSRAAVGHRSFRNVQTGMGGDWSNRSGVSTK